MPTGLFQVPRSSPRITQSLSIWRPSLLHSVVKRLTHAIERRRQPEPSKLQPRTVRAELTGTSGGPRCRPSHLLQQVNRGRHCCSDLFFRNSHSLICFPVSSFTCTSTNVQPSRRAGSSKRSTPAPSQPSAPGCRTRQSNSIEVPKSFKPRLLSIPSSPTVTQEVFQRSRGGTISRRAFASTGQQHA